jgi:small redox-active disulfide protein 2
MLNITVYGPGCAKCKETEKRVRNVVQQSGIEATISHAMDFAEMAKAGILMTPAVVINGVVRFAGRIPNENEIREWLSETTVSSE